MFETLRDGLEFSEYKHIRINLNSAYKWSRGWTPREKNEFESCIYSKMQDAGFKIKDGEFDGSCERLKKSRSSLDIYMHPMEFTGYATEEELNKIVEVLNDCTEVCEITGIYTEDVYALTEDYYIKVLAQHSEELLEYFRKLKSKRMNATWDIPYEFARRYRIPRVGDCEGCLSCSDADIKFLTHFGLIAEGLGLI